MNNLVGTVVEVVDPVLYVIKVNVPGVHNGLVASPRRSELDEPKVGDQVLVDILDSNLFSYNLYTKVKEDEFNGMRSQGKVLDMKADEITLGIFDGEYKEADSPECTSFIKIKSDGTIQITGMKLKIEVDGEVDLKASGSVKVDSPDVKISGGKLTVNGNASPTGSGPFCGIKICPFTGAPHVGNMVSGT